jgi:LacI family transcriptional regulator
VAAQAGVSIGTASKALNGQGKLRAATRDRVAAAARELGFAPNVLAKALLAGRTYTVGLITSDSFGRFSIPVMLGAEDALGAGQISVFMCDTRDDPDRERQYLEMLLSRRVDGLIVTGRRIEPRPSIGALDIPVVYAMTQSLDSDEPAILPDDYGGGQLAARHFLAAGRRRLGHITGPERFLAARKRAGGFCEAAAGGGAEFSPNDVLYGEWSERWGREGAHILLRIQPDVTAIFCGSDQIARGVADTLRILGHRVPQDIALIGFDNWTPMAQGADPPLTSIDMCLEDVGRVAAEHLLAAINDAPTHGVHTVPCRLVARQSTDPVPVATSPAAAAGAGPAGGGMAGAELAGADVAGAELAGADVAGAELAGGELAGADVAGADVADPELADAAD